MATTSTVPAVRAALVSLLEAAIADSTVQVLDGPTPDHLAKRKAVVVSTVSYSSEIANIKAGRKQRDERYTVDVVFLVARPRGRADEANTEVWTLFGHLEDVLADDPSLGGIDGVVWVRLGAVTADVAQEQEGPVAWISAGVDCYGRLV